MEEPTCIRQQLITICKQICYNLDLSYDDIPQDQDIFQADLTNGGKNVLQLDKFGADAADRVLHTWLQNQNKKLTNFQFRVLQNVFSVCSVLLFCKLAFTEAIRWRSYHEKEQTFLKNAVEKSIDFFCLIKLSKDLILC